MISILLKLGPDLVPDHLVGESEHATIGLKVSMIISISPDSMMGKEYVCATYVVHDDNLSSPEELLRDNNAAECIASPAACIADDVGVALFETKGTGSVWVGLS